LEQDVKETAGLWVMEPLDIYNPYSGVTSNMAESTECSCEMVDGVEGSIV